MMQTDWWPSDQHIICTCVFKHYPVSTNLSLLLSGLAITDQTADYKVFF